jgi:hypothetical protein
MFTPSFTPTGEHSLLFRQKNGGANREFHPKGITSTPGDKIHPWGQSLPLGARLRMGPGVDVMINAIFSTNFSAEIFDKSKQRSLSPVLKTQLCSRTEKVRPMIACLSMM